MTKGKISQFDALNEAYVLTFEALKRYVEEEMEKKKK